MVFFKLCGFGCYIRDYLNVAAFKLVCRDDVNHSGGCTRVYGRLDLLLCPLYWVCPVILNDSLVFKLNYDHSIFICRNYGLVLRGRHAQRWWEWRGAFGIGSDLCPRQRSLVPLKLDEFSGAVLSPTEFLIMVTSFCKFCVHLVASLTYWRISRRVGCRRTLPMSSTVDSKYAYTIFHGT